MEPMASRMKNFLMSLVSENSYIAFVAFPLQSHHLQLTPIYHQYPMGILYHEKMMEHVDACYFGIPIGDTPAQSTHMTAKAR